MKLFRRPLALLCWGWCAGAGAFRVSNAARKTQSKVLATNGGRTWVAAGASSSAQRTVGEVVRLLRGMLDKSKAEAYEEKRLFEKIQCYCHETKRAKEQEISTLVRSIGVLQAREEELQGAGGRLSVDAARLAQDLASNSQRRQAAEEARQEEARSYASRKQDLETSLQLLNRSMDVLAAVGADQTSGPGSDHSGFMAAFPPPAASLSLPELEVRGRQQLRALAAVLPEHKAQMVESLLELQEPFTGAHKTQAAEVMGILQNMWDSFRASLAALESKESARQASFQAFMGLKQQSQADLNSLLDGKQESAGSNEDRLGTTRQQLQEALLAKQTDEALLAELRPTCASRTVEHRRREDIRSQEEVAITQTLAILGQSAALETLMESPSQAEAGQAAGVEAGVGVAQPTFLQLQLAASSASSLPTQRARRAAWRLLQAAAGSRAWGSARLLRVAAALECGGPLQAALTEMANVQSLLDAEAARDRRQLDWCTAERARGESVALRTGEEVASLDSSISTLLATLEDPQTGLTAQIQELEQDLQENYLSQKTETGIRAREAKAYEHSVEDIARAESLLSSAIAVLSKFYNRPHQKTSRQEQEQTNAVLPGVSPSNVTYEGQSAKGAEVLTMLNFILNNTKMQATQAHTDEASSQKDYEQSMEALQSMRAQLQESLISLQQAHSGKERSLSQTRSDLVRVSRERATVQAYLLSLKPGCDFITQNFTSRQQRRLEEVEALKQAKSLLMDSPAFQAGG